MDNGSLLLGLDIGGTKCAACVGTVAGEILDRRDWPSLTERGPDAMIHDLCRHARELLATHKGVGAVGVAIGGPLDVDRGAILSPPNLPGWDDVPLRRILEVALSRRVIVEHDAAACAKAEYLWGADRKARTLAYLTCGTGFGVGIVLAGRTYRGAQGRNCEIGHIRYRLEGPEAFGKKGSFEAYCAGASLGKLASWAFPQRWPAPPRAQELAQLAGSGDEAAGRVLAIQAEAVGHACAVLGDLLCPEVILLGSLARYLGDNWVEAVRQAFLDEAGQAARDICRIKPASLGTRLQDCSALAAAVSDDL